MKDCQFGLINAIDAFKAAREKRGGCWGKPIRQRKTKSTPTTSRRRSPPGTPRRGETPEKE